MVSSMRRRSNYFMLRIFFYFFQLVVNEKTSKIFCSGAEPGIYLPFALRPHPMRQTLCDMSCARSPQLATLSQNTDARDQTAPRPVSHALRPMLPALRPTRHALRPRPLAPYAACPLLPAPGARRRDSEVRRSRGLSLFSAMCKALGVPIKTTIFLPRVMAVYNKFLCNKT